MIIYSESEGNFAIAQAYFRAGLNVLPLHVDGSRVPKIRWESYIGERFPWSHAKDWFSSLGRPSGIAIICGSTSGNLEVIDHDVFWTFTPWASTVEAKFPGLIKSLPIVATPSKAWHVYYRCPQIAASQVLSRDEAGDILVETRAQGSMAVAPGSPATTHKLGRLYKLINGDLLNVPTITPEQRQAMLDAGRQFNRLVEKPKPAIERRPVSIAAVRSNVGSLALPTAARPGDLFAAQTDWEEILEPHGWEIEAVRSGVTYWRKPGSYGPQHHATTNHGGKDLFYVFSSAVEGFDPGRSYNKFAAFTILACGGDFSEAARRLRNNYESVPEDHELHK